MGNVYYWYWNILHIITKLRSPGFVRMKIKASVKLRFSEKRIKTSVKLKIEVVYPAAHNVSFENWVPG